MSLTHTLKCGCNPGFVYSSNKTFENHLVSQRHEYFEMKEKQHEQRLSIQKQTQTLVQRDKLIQDLQETLQTHIKLLEEERQRSVALNREINRSEKKVVGRDRKIRNLQRQNKISGRVCDHMHHVLWKMVMDEMKEKMEGLVRKMNSQQNRYWKFW